MKVEVKGVPIGGNMADKNYTDTGEHLTQQQAIEYLQTELSNYKTQIAAEALSVLCKISFAQVNLIYISSRLTFKITTL
jgi:hypothetical protein